MCGAWRWMSLPQARPARAAAPLLRRSRERAGSVGYRCVSSDLLLYVARVLMTSGAVRRDYPSSGVGLLHACPTRRNSGLPGAGALLALDQPVDVRAQPRELGQLLGRDLVAGPGQVDRDHLLDLGRRVRE